MSDQAEKGPAYRGVKAVNSMETYAAVVFINDLIDKECAKRTAALLEALEAANMLCEKALPEFDWGKSALSAEAIQLLNEVPGQISAAIAQATKGE